MRRALALALLALALAAPARAVEPGEVLPDPALEARARSISRELRCLVCQNESIDDSNADLAHDLRVVVRQRLTAGDSDSAVLGYIVQRYGDFVLLRPPVKPTTWVLWFGPAVLLALGAAAVAVAFRRRRVVPVAPLSDAERRRLAELVGEPDPSRLGVEP